MESFVVFGLGAVAFGLASPAAQSWRELGILVVLSALIYWPAKWLAADTFPGGDMLTFIDGGFSVVPSGATIVAVLLAAIVMIFVRHVMLARREKKAAE